MGAGRDIKRKLLLAVLLAVSLPLSSCASMKIDYVPQTLGDPANAKQFADDVAFCYAAARAWTPQPVAGDIAQATADGGAGMISYVPINPLVPALGAAGGAITSAGQGFDVTGHAFRNVEKHCIRERASKDGSALVANPDD